ncbi:MAG: hypothetical protein IPO42_10980 [Chitinophagaceae bacterium]|nr:hypothetical protein [Chitinophagaceae bacterium]
MNKILLIIQREFLTRVKKKPSSSAPFFPGAFPALIFGSGYIADKTREDLKNCIDRQVWVIYQDQIEQVNGKIPPIPYN